VIVKVPLSLAVPRMQPLTFAPPSVMNDTTQARAKVEREALVTLREMDRYFGRKKFKELVQEVTKGGQGNTPKDERNARILAEWKEAGHKNRSRFAREYCGRHPEEGSGPKAHTKVRGQLNRLLKDEQREAKEDAGREREFQEAVRYRGKSLLGGDTK
jgi:hypothetical protein